MTSLDRTSPPDRTMTCCGGHHGEHATGCWTATLACTCDRSGHGCEKHSPQPRERAVHLACGHDTWRVDLGCDRCPAVYVGCEWFALCDKVSVATVDHPTLGDTEICQTHLDWITSERFAPTVMLPPMVAARLSAVDHAHRVLAGADAHLADVLHLDDNCLADTLAGLEGDLA